MGGREGFRRFGDEGKSGAQRGLSSPGEGVWAGGAKSVHQKRKRRGDWGAVGQARAGSKPGQLMEDGSFRDAGEQEGVGSLPESCGSCASLGITASSPSIPRSLYYQASRLWFPHPGPSTCAERWAHRVLGGTHCVKDHFKARNWEHPASGTHTDPWPRQGLSGAPIPKRQLGLHWKVPLLPQAQGRLGVREQGRVLRGELGHRVAGEEEGDFRVHWRPEEAGRGQPCRHFSPSLLGWIRSNFVKLQF